MKRLMLALALLCAGFSHAANVDLCTAAGVDNTGAHDSNRAVVAVLNAIAGTANIGVSNCTIWLKQGYDPSTAIFIRNGTNLNFGPNGIFLVDNVLVPVFSFLNTTNSTWSNVKIKYIGGETLDANVAPYASVGGTYNDVYAKGELQRQGYTFSGGGSNLYTGLLNQSASIMIRGSANNLTFNNLKLYVDPGTNAAHFMPIGVSWDPEWKCCNVTTNSTDNYNATFANSPTNITFNSPVLDGVYMGFVSSDGGTVTINNARGYRYSDLQDSSGGTQGGVAPAHWFAPPHFMYLQDGDASFHNHYTVNGAIDYGIYVGGATRRDAGSGTLVSMKIALTNGTVINGYETDRPDGCADTIANFAGASVGTVNNMVCVYDSTVATADGGHIWGLRFPTVANPYVGVTFNHYRLLDTATSPQHFPVEQLTNNAGNNNLTFTDFHIYQHIKTGPFPSISGTNIHSDMTLHIDSCSGGRPAGGTNNPGTVIGC